MLNQETGLRGYLITGRTRGLEPYQAGRPALDEAINRLKALISTEGETARLLADATAVARTWQTNIGEVVTRNAADPATRPSAIRLEANGEGKQLFDTFRAKLTAIETVEEENRSIQNVRLIRAESNARMALWAGALLTLLICLGVGIAINRLIVWPIIDVMAFVERVGGGDLTGRLAAKSRNEIGRLGVTLNAMVGGLTDLARTNRSATNDLNAAAAEIRASTQEQAASVEEQFATVQETAATVDEIAHLGSQITKRANEVILTARRYTSFFATRNNIGVANGCFRLKHNGRSTVGLG